MTADELVNLLIVDAVVAIIIIAMSIKYLKEWNDDRKGKK